MLQQIKTKAILVLAFLLGGISVDMLAQQSVSEKKIGLPPNTVEGVLPNGLHYLILPNGTPAHTTEFRLVMRPFCLSVSWAEPSRITKRELPISWNICLLPVVNTFPDAAWWTTWKV